MFRSLMTVTLALVTASAHAHYLFIQIGPHAEAGRNVEVYFSERATAGDPKFVAKIVQTELWCQEEPGNQGAWHRIQHYLVRHLRADQKLTYALRPSSAAPAGGYLALHNQRQKAAAWFQSTPATG